MHAPRGRHLFPRPLHCLICNKKYRFQDIDLLSIWPTKLSDTFLKNTTAGTALPWNKIHFFFPFFCTAFYLPGLSSTMLWKHNKCFPKRRTRKLKGSHNSKFIWIFVEYLWSTDRWQQWCWTKNSFEQKKININARHIWCLNNMNKLK